MTAARVRLKTLLELRDRRCPQCLARDGQDAHEVIVTRGAVRGNERLTQEVTEAYQNVTLLCGPCHQSPDRDALTDYLVRSYGEREITYWIAGLGLKNPGPYLAYVRGRAEAVRAADAGKEPECFTTLPNSIDDTGRPSAGTRPRSS